MGLNMKLENKAITFHSIHYKYFLDNQPPSTHV